MINISPKANALEHSSITKFRVAKEFNNNTKRINSIDYSHDGQFLLTSSDDDTIVLYECDKGINKRTIASKKYGVDLIRYTHASNTAVHTSTKENDIIRYLSLHDNKYLRYFQGHEKRVTQLCMSPADDTFLSGSLDQTVRHWDLRTEKGHSKLDELGPFPIMNFDPEGLIFAVGVNSEYLKFYDLRHLSKGPFNTVHTPAPQPPLQWRSLLFSPDGKQILLTTNVEEMYVLDAFSGQPLHKLALGPKLDTPLGNTCEASYTPDSQYILTGSMDGSVHVFSASKGTRVTILKPTDPKSEPMQCIKFNPKYMLMATAASRLSFWIPSPDDTTIV